MNLGNSLLLISFWGIWLILVYWVFLSIGAVLYARQTSKNLRRFTYSPLPEPVPTVTILVPAHNESLVIADTVEALCEQDYPNDGFEVIVIDDGSSDDTADIVENLRQRFSNLRLIKVPIGKGGKGKSRTLNIGLQYAAGELIAVFDADNTPERNFLRLTVTALVSDERLVAVNGKVRTRNYDATWLTRFINLEFMYFQWLFQGGRWYWFGLSSLMGTGYVVYRSSLDILGGFDEESLVDDTEMSLRIFSGNYRIRWVPTAVTWEQEPETLAVWIRQRTRWVQGNFSVVLKYSSMALKSPYPLGLEIITMVLNYIIFLPALFLSYIVFSFSISGVLLLSLPGPFIFLWIMAGIIYIIHMSFVISIEQRRYKNYLLAVLGYFTYAQFFIIVVLRSIFLGTVRRLRGDDIIWVKTTRTMENRK